MTCLICRKGFAGTPGYLSPEVLRKDPYGKPVDIWACGESPLPPGTSLLAALEKCSQTSFTTNDCFVCRREQSCLLFLCQGSFSTSCSWDIPLSGMKISTNSTNRLKLGPTT